MSEKQKISVLLFHHFGFPAPLPFHLNGDLIRSIDYDYNAAGMITNKTITGGTSNQSLSYEYDTLDRLTRETKTSVGGNSVFDVQYSYDLAGNRRTKTANNNTVSYTLGTGNRLASWDATYTNNFVVDVRGTSTETIGTDDRWGTLYVSNLTAQVGTKPQVDGTSFLANNLTMQMGANQLVAAIRDSAGNMGYTTNTVVYTVVTNGTFKYNAAGCITNISHSGTDSYSDSLALDWDERYRLKSVKSAQSVDVSYTYDVLNRRTSRTAGGSPATTEYYIYDGNQIIADVDSSGNLLRTYIYGSGIDNILSMTVYETSITNTYYYLKDHQNTVLALVDSSGTVVETYEYDAWGRTTIYSATGTQLEESAVGNRYGFQGREIDWATGLYYFRARWYNPITGRWLSKDPIGIAGGLNLYVFCDNNPVNHVDPYGNRGTASNGGTNTLSQAFLDQVVQDTSDRLDRTFHAPEAVFDTLFYDGDKTDVYWNYNGDIDRGDSINYLGIGMYEAHLGHDMTDAYFITYLWKDLMYGLEPTESDLEWLKYGYDEWHKRHCGE